MVAAAQELERQKAELQARRQLEFQRQKTKSLEVAAQKRMQEEEVICDIATPCPPSSSCLKSWARAILRRACSLKPPEFKRFFRDLRIVHFQPDFGRKRFLELSNMR